MMIMMMIISIIIIIVIISIIKHYSLLKTRLERLKNITQLRVMTRIMKRSLHSC